MFAMTARPVYQPPPSQQTAHECSTAAAAAPGDLAALKLQQSELQRKAQSLQDAQLAMQLFLEELDDAAEPDVEAPQYLELQSLQQQIASLAAAITAAEDEHAALRMLDAEEAMQAASLQLADALFTQEQYDAAVLRPHDADMARTIAGCDEWEWQQRGDWLERPLDISDRPDEPVVAVPTPAQQLQHWDWQSSDSPDGWHQMSAEEEDALAANCNYVLNIRLPASFGTPPSSPSRQAGHSSSSGAHGCASASRSGGYAGASSSSSRFGDPGASSSKAAAGAVQCGICFDMYAASSMVSAYQPPDAACCSSGATARCGHLYCADCMHGYVQDKVQSRKYPIPCPDPECHLELGVDDIQALLARDTHILQVFDFLIAEHLIDTARRVYCPYKDCSVLLERPEPEEEMVDEAGNQEAPYECPCCKRQFCLSCGITGWHTGLTCRDFKTLPPELRSAEDAAVHHIAQHKSWKRCPAQGCGHMVERVEGCNHVACVCGCSFCYACGVPYQGETPTAANTHGTPGCTCALFTVPEEVAEEEEADADEPGYLQAQLELQQQMAPAPVVLHQADRRPKPWRNGRFVSRTRCRHSVSIYDCPMGPSRCWFWHEEDDEVA